MGIKVFFTMALYIFLGILFYAICLKLAILYNKLSPLWYTISKQKDYIKRMDNLKRLSCIFTMTCFMTKSLQKLVLFDAFIYKFIFLQLKFS